MDAVVGTITPQSRSHIYRLLAAAFRYPTPGYYEALRSGVFGDELMQLLAQLPSTPGDAEFSPRALVQDVAPLSLAEFQDAFIRTFDVGAPAPPCPPYEGSYRDGVPKARVLLQVTGFYKHFGLRMSTEEGKRELPDHIAAELEFMHFLAFKEAQAREQREDELLRGYLLAQRDFLARHLCRWMPRFVQKLDAARSGTAFASLAGAVAEFLKKDLALVQGYLKDMGITETPAPPAREAIPIVAQDDAAPPGAEPGEPC